MNIKSILFFAIASLFVFSCNNDDNNNLTQAEQNDLDDLAIIKYLEEHYFDAQGVVQKFDDDTTEDDNETPLYDIAVQDPMGYWYVKNPDVTAEGPSVTNNETDSILIQHNTFQFLATTLEDEPTYGFPLTYSSTINQTGYPQWDPVYYFTDVDEDNEDDLLEHYVAEGFVDAIKHFNATNRDPEDLPLVNLQGLIIIPSRLVMARDFNRIGLSRDTSLIINFELYKVIPRS